MDTPSTGQLVISKKTGALVFFVGCAVGLIMSEILVGVASQKAQQEARRASIEYIEQVQSGGNGSFTVKQQADIDEKLHRQRQHAASLSPGEHLAAVQTGILVSRSGTSSGKATLEKTALHLEEQKLRHRLQAEQEREKKRHKKSSLKRSKNEKRANGKDKIPDTIGLIRMKAGGNDGVLAHICWDKNDKNCQHHKLDAPRRRVKRHIRRKHHYDIKVVTATKPPATQTNLRKLPSPPATTAVTVIIPSPPRVTTTHVKPSGPGALPAAPPQLAHQKGPQTSSNRLNIFHFRKPKTASANTTVSAGKTHHGKKHKKHSLSTANLIAVTAPPAPNNSLILTKKKVKVVEVKKKPNKPSKETKKDKKISTVSKQEKAAVNSSSSAPFSWFSTPFRSKKKNHTIVKPTVKQSTVKRVPLAPPKIQDGSGNFIDDQTQPYLLPYGEKSEGFLTAPIAVPAFDEKVRRNPKTERACRRMMKDMEAFERDEEQKSQELMMVSFRDGVDEVQSLMHTWIKTPVHVMEGITFFSILICLVLYWVEDSIQSRLRKIGFNI